ncbi:sacsin [Corythoichthys intestinalis]|uniref:sacsin n=1 Tax=Corythoichthys intestinalis TaxID=161448 RepID=UPI0025A608F3|nr:sacsin [Corythoichthys intestinalis]XP_057707715.1 sacsin [Corythoichthys intestinalis]XP_057707717.1 sacsin [Corythoichthys intestinalis]XP_061799473.1 sacsin [Nerophis lumbriciformis]
MSMSSKKKTRTSFGATAPPFIDYLKDILRRYPDGGQILKELIQNADDAQATNVTFIHDERSYGTQSLWTDALGKFQGPSLYSYNNAPFSDEDWEGIQAVGRSVKRDDPATVGRFGIGFNSVYHITDVPSIFSSGYLGFLDPQEKIFGERQGGFRWALDDTEHQEVLTSICDQFQPFRDILKLVSGQEWSKVITEDQHFEGTIFRFPLRAEVSDISDNLYNADKVVELFESFIADAELSLLFLRNVTTVTLLHIDVDGSVSKRLEVKSSASADVVLEPRDNIPNEGSTRLKVITIDSEDHIETKWLVTTYTVKEGTTEELDILAQKLSFVPQVDLAFPCGETRAASGSRLSCFLPLPNNESNKTGLPVQINACFGLTDNRRHIKWQEEDQLHDEHAMWNELLMKEVLPQAYKKIIGDAVRHVQKGFLPVSSVYELWPDLTRIQHKEKWHAIAVDILHQLFLENGARLSLARDERKFISPMEAVLPCQGPIRPDIQAAIHTTLLSGGENLVILPSNVATAIETVHPHASILIYATPAFLRDVLHRVDMKNMSRDDKLSILEYILRDGEYSELQGLELLPLSDGSFRAFTDEEEDTALIDSEEFPRVLLPFCKHLFIPEDLSPACTAHLKQLARENLFKIMDIDAEEVAKYTRRYLPEEWTGLNTALVKWDLNESLHPSLDWLQEFWKFLNNHFTKLNSFIGIPLIPVGPFDSNQSVLLAKMNANTTLVFHQRMQARLPDRIAEFVQKVGGTVVWGNKWLKHDDLDSYVLYPSARSVVTILMNVEYGRLFENLETMSPETREELKDYLSSLDSLSNSEKELLLKMPLFQNTKGVPIPAQSKKGVLLGCGPKIPTDLPMPDSIVLCTTEADRRLLRLLNVHLLDTAEAAHLLIDNIEGKVCSKEDTTKIMTWILQHGSILFSQNKTLKCRCQELNFMEANGVLKKASHFLHPRIPIFQVIFDPSFFPPSPYLKSEQMLDTLTDLGVIKSEADVSPEHLLHAATEIDSLHLVSQPLKRAQSLLNMLDAHCLLPKFSQKQLDVLKMLKWVPCANPSNTTEQISLFCPNEIRHTQYKDVVGHVMPLIGSLSDRASNKLGFKCCPPPNKVMENLYFLIASTDKMEDPDTNGDFKRKLHSIYKYMQDQISNFTTLLDKNACWLWCGDQFVSPGDLVLDYPRNLDLSSWVKNLPKEFLPYKKLLTEFGMRLSLTEHDTVDILHSMMKTIEGKNPPIASPSEIKASVEIVKWIWKEKMMVPKDIPVPVTAQGGQYTLKSLSTAIFCDMSKKTLEALQYSNEQVCFLHEEIPKAAAEYLDIQFLSMHILRPELVGIEQCGQSEPITMRIKNILKEYDDESDLFKELIQNAEDAGAGTCKFLVDFRVHKNPPENLIDPGMIPCQGPCLWAFNDEMFTNEDWENIVRVGSASKEDKVGKIGKFGLGFNTVYHVTDVPSVLSGSKLLILDPNVTHLKKFIRNKSNPGIKLDLSNENLCHCFPGQFGPYENIFQCSFTTQSPPDPYQGTLIKLPFRTKEEALMSGISTKVYDRERIITLQREFTNNSEMHILFLKNINTLSLLNISKKAATPPRDEEIETLLKVTKTTLLPIQIPGDSHSRQIQAEMLLLKCGKNCKDVIDCSTVNIVQISSEQSSKRKSQSWLVYNCFGTNQSLKMTLQKEKQANFSLPIGGVAVPLKKDQESVNFTTSDTKLNGQAFCFLPLAIDTGLPVNVNGTFAVTSNRKGLWESGVKHYWNKALLQDPIVTAYVTSLLVLKKLWENGQLKSYSYHTFWPDREKVSDAFKPLVDELYATLAQKGSAPELFCDGKNWCSMKNVVFLHESIEEDEKLYPLVTQVCQKHVREPNHVVPLPRWLRNSFIQAGLGNVLQEKTWHWERFFQEVVFENLATLDIKTRDTLLLHAIDLNAEGIDHLLARYPCIPTKDGHLQYIKKLVNPSGKLSCLFEDEMGRLLEGTKNDFCSPKRIQRLLEHGMLNDHLSLEAIAEKAETIQTLWKTDKTKAYRHLKCLLELMKDHIYDTVSCHWKALREIPFLPAFYLNVAVLRKPVDIFNERCAPLVDRTQPVLDHSGLNIHETDPILQILGICDKPAPDIVLQQLQKAAEQCQDMDGSKLQKIAYECYSFLDRCVCDSEISEFVTKTANSFPFIFNGKTFVKVDRVALKGQQLEAKPYLHVLPPAFACFRNLWESIGVKDTFTLPQFLNVLQEVKLKHGDEPLSNDDLKLCLMILYRGIYSTSETPTKDCLIPNEHGVLEPASQLVFNDSPWMPVSKDLTLCHKDISRAMALHFGITTTRHHSLERYAIKNPSPYSFPFEQKEDLTVRIKNIISAYPSKKDILKELIQNADDADATEIHFVWDGRQHGTEKTFGDKWNKLQGPALCVYNNSVFSDADLIGIQQLGTGGKRHNPDKIGKYGLGFNAVFHLTDCPSILTGDDRLCISDPNKIYIESHSEHVGAGIGYELDDTFKEMYEDAYKSYLPDKYSLKDGTMIRLPLRTPSMAETSKISQQKVSERDIKELCSALSEDLEGLILFLKNIRKIEVFQINNDSDEMTKIFSVQKNPRLAEEDVTVDVSVLNGVFYKTIISTSDKRRSEWIIAEQFDTSHSAAGEGKSTQAMIAARVKAKGQSSDFKGEAFCMLPLPGTTGLPVHINADFEVDSARRSLWKQDGLCLKTDWNESLKNKVIAPLYADLLYYISRTISVKTASRKELDTCFTNSYLHFWPTVSENVDQEWHEMIHEVYRSISKRRLNVIPVLRRTTQVTNKKPLITITKYSIDWRDAKVTSPLTEPYMESPSTEINDILMKLGMDLVPIFKDMKRIWDSFKTAGVDVKDVNPPSVRTFLKTKPVHNPEQTRDGLPLPITDTLIKNPKICSELLQFCLSDISQEKITDDPTLLNGLPLLLTADEVLRVFDVKAPKMITIYTKLFSGYEHNFVHYQTNCEHLKKLEALSLASKLTVFDAYNWLKVLINQNLAKCELDPLCGLYVPTEEMLAWLKLLWRFLSSHIKIKSGESKIETKSGDKDLMFSDFKELFSDFPILPVVCPRSKKHLLKKIKDMPSVIPYNLDNDISGLLSKLGFMTRHNVFFTDCDQQRLSFLLPELMNVRNKSSVLDQVVKVNHSEFSRLSSADMKELQNYLQSGESIKCPTYQKKLRSLPIFETIEGNHVRIDDHQVVYILDMSTQSLLKFPDLFKPPENNSIFLKCSHENNSVSQTLNIETLDDLQYFMKILLPVVHKLSQHQKIQCLKLLVSLQNHDCYDQHKSNIISKLKNVPMIVNANGQVNPASYYFDDKVALYQAMLPPEMFVPQVVWTELSEGKQGKLQLAQQLLKELGMKHVVSKNDIVDFAKKLASEAELKGHSKELEEKSSFVFEEALRIAGDEETMLESITNIKFIFPVKVKKQLYDYHLPFAQETTAVQINGSLIDNIDFNQELIWSSMPIIHVKGSNQLPLDRLKQAGAHYQPPTHCVAKNIVNIFQSPCDTDAKIKTRATVFRRSYAYLQNNNFNRRWLAGLPIVLVEKDTKLVRADEVVFSLPDENDFRPYLYRISLTDLEYVRFFENIGVNKKPTAPQYCNVLAAVNADSSAKSQLNQNQRKTVQRAVQHLFLLLENAKQSLMDSVETLYLPAVDGKLYPSCDLYFNNTTFDPQRLEESLDKEFILLEKLSSCHLGTDIYELSQLLQLLPQRLQPKMLSHVTEEKVVQSQMQLCEVSPACEFLDWFNKHLNSAAFLHGLICLLREQSNGKTTPKEAADICKKIFGSIKIVCCTSLTTELRLKDRALKNTDRETDVFVEKVESGCVFYLKHNDTIVPKVISAVNMTLTKEITSLLGNRILSKHLLILGQLLMCDDLQDVRKTLAKNDIHDSAEVWSASQEAPKGEIPEEWLDSLDMNVLNNFEEGEYVGYCINDKYVYGVIVEEIPGQSGPYSKRYKIRIGEDETIEVSSVDLYQFKSESVAKPELVSPIEDNDLNSQETTPQYTSISSIARGLPATYEEAVKEIDQSLEEIWSLPQEERLKPSKRLYLKWHHDKNPQCYYATEVVTYVRSRNCFSFGDFYQQWDEEAQRHRSGRERVFRQYHSYNFWEHNEFIPRPNAEEARRWYRQARCDLNAAHSESNGSAEWCLFKIHQAVGKSLVAIEYKTNGRSLNGTIVNMSGKVSRYSPLLSVLPRSIANLQALGVDGKKTQYPNCLPFPSIPNECFCSADVGAALEIATELLAVVKAYVK